jgi:hypothetical protein
MVPHRIGQERTLTTALIGNPQMNPELSVTETSRGRRGDIGNMRLWLLNIAQLPRNLTGQVK